MTGPPRSDSAIPLCPVCCDPYPRPLLTIDDKAYWSCPTCTVRFLDPRHHPTRDQELAHYDLHENDPDDPAYQAFLSKLATPLLAKLESKQKILDYGAGPGPALAAMLQEAGHQVTVYDPFYAPDKSALNQTYDVITSTETVEHFHNPAAEFERLDQLLRPGGWLGIMTCFQTDDAKFANWHYRKDPTHVVFYRPETFLHISSELGWHCKILTKDVVLMQKSRP